MKTVKVIKRIDTQIAHLKAVKAELKKTKHKDIEVNFCMNEGGYTDPYVAKDFSYCVNIEDAEDPETGDLVPGKKVLVIEMYADDAADGY